MLDAKELAGYRPLHRRFSGWWFIGMMAMRFFSPDV
jgi:hypothetical protein